MSILNAAEGLLKMLILKYEIPVEVEVSDKWEERKSICDICNRKNGMLCGECGCVIEAKVLIKLESCPLGKW